LARAIALPIGLLQAMLLTRMLAAADVGSYFLAVRLIGLLAILAQVGLARPMVKLVASALALDRPEAARHAIRVALLVTLAGGVLLALTTADGPGRWLTTTLNDGRVLRAVLPILAVTVPAFALIDVIAETLRGFHDLRAASAFSDYLAQRALLVLALGVIWLAGWTGDLTAIMVAALGAALLVLALALGQLWHRMAGLGRYGARWRTAEVLGHGLPFLLMRVNVWFTAGADLWVLGMFRPPEEVAIYGAASRLAVIVGTLLAVSNAVLAPAIVELHSRGDRARLERVIRAAATMAVLPSLLVVLAFVLIGDRLLALLFTDAYRAGYPVMVCLALGQLANVAFGSCGIALTMTGHQRDVMIASTLAAVLTIVGIYLVAAPFGMLGIAVVVSTSLASYNLIMTWIVRRRLGITAWASLSLDAFRELATELRQALGRPA
jgi:O-antigen/teichoic acid export membrane protein